jgi:hypothetical protein
MHMVDEPGSEEVPHDRRAATDTDVLTVGCRSSGLEGLGGCGLEEVEAGAALHRDRGPRTVGEDEGRGVERRVRAPPAGPLRVVLPSGWAELVGAHDLGADAGTVTLSEGVVDTVAAGRVPELRGEHPLVQTRACVSEGCVGRLWLPGGEAVEGDGEVVDPRESQSTLLR